VGQFKLTPSGEIDSGGGIQALWRFRNPVTRPEGDGEEWFKRVEAINKAIMTVLGSGDTSGLTHEACLSLR
jgi:hypothetical protein